MDLKQILEKYNNILKNYQDTTVNLAMTKSFNGRKKYDFILNRMHSFYIITHYISSLNMKTDDEYEKVLFTILNKAALDLLGAFYCLYNGLEIQAGIISRSLYELYLTTALIFKEDTKERIKLFANFQHIQRWNVALDHLKNEGEEYFSKQRISKEKLTEWETNYNQLINDYNPNKPHYWAYKIFKDKIKKENPSFLDICKYLGNEYVKEYRTSYPTLCVQSHPSSIIGDYYTTITKEGYVVLNSPMYKDTLVSSAYIDISHCEEIIEKIIIHFNIDDVHGIISYMREFLNDTYTLSKNYLDKNNT